MMDTAPGCITFRVHGPDTSSDELLADVFAQKLGALIRALHSADEAANGRRVHEYTIAKLQTSTPTALIRERPMPQRADMLSSASSGIDAFDTCATLIQAGDREGALRFGRTAQDIERLAGGSKKKYAYAEAWTSKENVIRIDTFLAERSRAIIMPPDKEEKPSGFKWFEGVTHGSFVGDVRAVDMRGARPEIALVLGDGAAEINCICREDHVEQIRAALRRRTRITGRAIYDGTSGLPRRIDVTDIEQLGEGVDFTRWRGAVASFEPSDWEGEAA